MKIKTIFLFLVLALVIFAIGCAKKEVAKESKGETGAGESGIDLTNIKTLADLIALGKGIVCDVQTSVNGQTMTIKYYIKGEKYKVEGQMQQGSFVYLRPNDGYFYMKMPTATQMPPGMQCEWLKFKETETSGAEQVGEGIETEVGKIETPVNSVEWKCYEQTLSDAIFTAPSNACSFEDFMQGMGNFQT